ncbi:hypothetical protein F5141DRAFT_1063059 [Pisolithus sp. B1]|nr:hypothetical protein F5141DRAFT_1063059 [Pisolithus sp. B1]
MDSQPEDSYGYPTDTDAGQPMDDAGEELVEGPDGNFDVVELEVLARRRREWTQVGKKEKPSIMRKICKEFAKMEEHCDLWLVKWKQKEEIQLKHSHMKIEGGAQATKQIDLYQQALSAFIQEDLTDEQRQAAHNITEKWNGLEGPTPEVQAQNAKKYSLKYMQNFMEEMWWYCGMRIVSLAGWKNEEGIIQACCMDFNNDIGGSHMFDDIHTISASWREYPGNAYENPDIAAGEEVQNITANQPRAKMGDPVKLVTNNEGDIWIGDLNGHNCNSILQMVQGYLTVHYHEPQSHACFHGDGVAQLLERMPDTEQEATNDMHIPELSSRGKSSDPRHHCKKTPMPFRHPTHRDTNDEDQHGVMSTKDERAGNEALPVVKCPSTSRQSTIQLKGSQVTAELQDASGYMDDDDFDSMPFADVHTTQSGLSRQHDQGGKLKSAMKNHAGHKQNNMEAQPKLKTSSNPQQSTVKPTKRCRGTNDHSSPPGPSTEAVQLWKSPRACHAPVPADANTPSPPPKKMWKNKPAKRHGNL